MADLTLTITDLSDSVDGATGEPIQVTVQNALPDAGTGGGAVDSVNGQTGTVVLTASDVGAATTAQGSLADSAVQPGDLATVATTGAYSDLTGQPTIPSTAGDVGAVPTTRTVNSKALSADISLAASDVGAAATSHTHAESDVTNLTTDLAAKLAKASNLSDVASASTARTNLGLGTAATVDTGTSSGNVPLLGTGGRLAIARVASGTPDGTKFVRDDGTLATPSGGGGGAIATTQVQLAADFTSNTTSAYTDITGLSFTITPTADGVLMLNSMVRAKTGGSGNIYMHAVCTPNPASGSAVLGSSLESYPSTALHTYPLVGNFDLVAGTTYTVKVQFWNGAGTFTCEHTESYHSGVFLNY